MTEEPLKHPTELAAEFIARMTSTGACLDFSEKSVELLDDWIEEDRADASLNENGKFARSQFYGAYLGECIRKKCGGEWQFSNDSQEWRLVFRNNLGSAGPMGKAWKQLTQGREDGESVSSFYRVALAIVEKGGIENIGSTMSRPPTWMERILQLFKVGRHNKPRQTDR